MRFARVGEPRVQGVALAVLVLCPDAGGRARPEPLDPAPLLGLLAEAGARVEGPRLLDGRFVLKAELGNALLQFLVPSGRAFGPSDGIMAKLGLGREDWTALAARSMRAETPEPGDITEH